MVARALQVVGPIFRRVIFPHVPSGVFALDKGVFRGGEPRVEIRAADAKVAPDPVSPRARVFDAPLIEGLLGNLQLMADLLGRHPLVDETRGGGCVVWLLGHRILLFNLGSLLPWRKDAETT